MTDFLFGVVPRADDQDAAAVGRQHRLLGVDDQVQQHLLHLVAVGEHLRQAGGERVDDRDVRDALLVGAQRERLAHDLVHVHHRARRLPLAREGQQVADDARGALGFAEDRLEAAADRLVERRALRQALGPAEDRRERVVQLVRDAGDRLAERRHLLRLQELVIDVARLVVELLALADVADERLDAQRAVVARRIGARRQLDPDRRCRRRGAGAAGSRSTEPSVREPLEERDARLRIDEAVGDRTGGRRLRASRRRSRRSA